MSRKLGIGIAHMLPKALSPPPDPVLLGPLLSLLLPPFFFLPFAFSFLAVLAFFMGGSSDELDDLATFLPLVFLSLPLAFAFSSFT